MVNKKEWGDRGGPKTTYASSETIQEGGGGGGAVPVMKQVSRQRQSDNGIEHQGQEKIRKMLRLPCLNGVSTPNIYVIQKSTIVWPKNMVMLSRQCCGCQQIFN